jgi:hypothetical protein
MTNELGRVTVEARVDNLKDAPVLIGQIPLECFDFVVDPNSQRLIGNPAQGANGRARWTSPGTAFEIAFVGVPPAHMKAAAS